MGVSLTSPSTLKLLWRSNVESTESSQHPIRRNKTVSWNVRTILLSKWEGVCEMYEVFQNNFGLRLSLTLCTSLISLLQRLFITGLLMRHREGLNPSTQSKGYKLDDHVNGKSLISRDVVSNEEESWNFTSMETNSSSKIPYTSQDDVFGAPVVHSSPESSPPGSIPSSSTTNNNVNGSRSSSTSDDEAELRYKSLEDIYSSCSFALFELFTLPEGKTPIGLKWVFKVKHNVDGSVKRYTVRLVANGYSQHQSIDYDETFSPVARFETVYVSQPEGFEVCGNENKVYKLKKALYGLKQAPRAWYKRVDFGLWCLKSTNVLQRSLGVRRSRMWSLYHRLRQNYVVVASATCQAIWLRRMLVDFHNEQYGPTTIFYDNKATIASTRNLTFHSRTKHIDIHFHFIHDLTSEGIIEMKYCPINEQVADVFTKALSQAKHEYFRQKLIVCKFRARGCIE
ncbi:retrovirus-related pol polyprotein from transposon TNT 1-94 [Tanacetum coccineum]